MGDFDIMMWKSIKWVQKRQWIDTWKQLCVLEGGENGITQWWWWWYLPFFWYNWTTIEFHRNSVLSQWWAFFFCTFFVINPVSGNPFVYILYCFWGGSKGTGKGKAVPLQAGSGPDNSRNLRFPDFMTMAQDGGKVSLTHRPPLLPGNAPGTHFC